MEGLTSLRALPGGAWTRRALYKIAGNGAIPPASSRLSDAGLAALLSGISRLLTTRHATDTV